jgi:hypothetical protein
MIPAAASGARATDQKLVLAGQLHDVTELLELPLPKECAGGGFDADEARLQFPEYL